MAHLFNVLVAFSPVSTVLICINIIIFLLSRTHYIQWYWHLNHVHPSFKTLMIWIFMFSKVCSPCSRLQVNTVIGDQMHTYHFVKYWSEPMFSNFDQWNGKVCWTIIVESSLEKGRKPDNEYYVFKLDNHFRRDAGIWWQWYSNLKIWISSWIEIFS